MRQNDAKLCEVYELKHYDTAKFKQMADKMSYDNNNNEERSYTFFGPLSLQSKIT